LVKKKSKEQQMMGGDEGSNYSLSAFIIKDQTLNVQGMVSSSGQSQLAFNYDRDNWNIRSIIQPNPFHIELSGGFGLNTSYVGMKLSPIECAASYTQPITNSLAFGTELCYQTHPMLPRRIGQHKTMLRYTKGLSTYFANLEYGGDQSPDTFALSHTHQVSKELLLATQLQFQFANRKNWETELRLGYTYELPDFGAKFRAFWSSKGKVFAGVEQPLVAMLLSTHCKLDFNTNELDVGMGVSLQLE